MPKPKIVVVGSLNVDHTMRVARLPAPGETLTAQSAMTCFGGKGANQAVAAARSGSAVSLIGCVGADDFGDRYFEHLQGEGIDVGGIVRSEKPTGSAFITVDDHGENTILVNPGANHALTIADIEKQAARIRDADALLLQLECPLPVVGRAADIARQAGVRVIINPSPWSPLFAAAAIGCDVLIVNEREATAVTNRSATEMARDIEETLRRARCGILVITRGGNPTLVLTTTHGLMEIPPPKVTPVDTVGAGDTFTGVFATAWAGGEDVTKAIAFANTAAALATLTPGAQPSIPRRAEILERLGGRRR